MLPYSIDHITVNQRRADQTLLTSWCMMLILKKIQRKTVSL